MKKLQHLVYFIDYYSPSIWWAEYYFSSLIEWISQNFPDCKISIFTSRFSREIAAIERVSPKITIYRYWSNRFNFWFLCLKDAISISKDCDLIHSTTHMGLLAAKVCGLINKKKIVVTVHEVLWDRWTILKWAILWRFYQLFECATLKLGYDKYICVSQSTLQDLKKRTSINKNAIVIYPWASLLDTQNIEFIERDVLLKQSWFETDSILWLFVGRACKLKGLDILLKSVAHILKSHKNFRLILVSHGSDKTMKSYKELAHDLGIEKFLHRTWPLKRSQRYSLMKSTNITIIPSVNEWFGFVWYEASHFSPSLVVSNVGSLPEVVFGENVVLFDGPNIHNLKNAISDAINNKWISLSKKKFPLDNFINQVRKVYEEI